MTRLKDNSVADEPKSRSGPLTDLALTLPIFLGYHLGVVFLPVRNAADLVTGKLQSLAEHNLGLYALLTLAIGVAYVTPLLMAGRGKHLKLRRFAWMSSEGIVYAIGMRLAAGYVVASVLAWVAMQDPGLIGLMNAAPALSSSVGVVGTSLDLGTRVSGAIMSMGAGFYEELIFRFVLYGLGGAALLFLFNITGSFSRFWLKIAWALAAACVFSGWHYFGDLSETFALSTFAFRTVCGLVFTLIYQLRGFAPAVWTHALYDLWVLAL